MLKIIYFKNKNPIKHRLMIKFKVFVKSSKKYLPIINKINNYKLVIKNKKKDFKQIINNTMMTKCISLKNLLMGLKENKKKERMKATN